MLDLLGDRKLDLPVFFDWERISGDTARTDGLDNETLTACAAKFCQTIESAGFDAGVEDYTFWCVGISTYPCFYYAHEFWQYSFKGTVPGINADCDLNMMFEK